MLKFSPLALLSLLLCILGLTSAYTPTPGTLYQGDTRKPADIKAKGGFTTNAADRGYPADTTDAAAIAHSRGGFNPRSGWISCSTSLSFTTKWIQKIPGTGKGSGWVYHVDTRGQTTNFVSMKELYTKAGLKYNRPNEAEFASKATIPWGMVIQWEVVKDGKVTKTEQNPDYTKIPRS